MSNDRKSDLSDFRAALPRLARRLHSAASIADLPLPASAGRRLREVAANFRGQASVARDSESGLVRVPHLVIRAVEPAPAAARAG
jgi:hypothetical protein